MLYSSLNWPKELFYLLHQALPIATFITRSPLPTLLLPHHTHTHSSFVFSFVIVSFGGCFCLAVRDTWVCLDRIYQSVRVEASGHCCKLSITQHLVDPSSTSPVTLGNRQIASIHQPIFQQLEIHLGKGIQTQRQRSKVTLKSVSGRRSPSSVSAEDQEASFFVSFSLYPACRCVGVSRRVQITFWQTRRSLWTYAKGSILQLLFFIFAPFCSYCSPLLHHHLVADLSDHLFNDTHDFGFNYTLHLEPAKEVYFNTSERPILQQSHLHPLAWKRHQIKFHLFHQPITRFLINLRHGPDDETLKYVAAYQYCTLRYFYCPTDFSVDPSFSFPARKYEACSISNFSSRSSHRISIDPLGGHTISAYRLRSGPFQWL